MTKTRKITIALLLAAVMTVSLLAVVACSGSKAIDSIEVTTPPTKTDYIVGETFDPAGMVVSVVYENGKTKVLDASEYSYSPTGALAINHKSIAITYEQDGQTYKAAQPITVHNKIVSGEIRHYPNKTSYMPGQKFEPDGMVVYVVYENGEDKEVAITSSNATYKMDGLTTDDTSLTVTYQGYKFTVTLTFTEGVYIEAEDGIMTGNAKVQTDAVRNDELAGEWDDRYLASGDKYVSDVGAGDKFTFVFEADKAGTGSITFRLSGKYLREDAGWIPIWMGDCQFNKMCKVYINRAPYEFSDDVILPGGGSEGGEPNYYLWFNWQEVTFDNIEFVEGVNLVTLEFLRHDYICSQSSFNNVFGANIDSLIVTADGDCKVTPYTGNLGDIEVEEPSKINYAATSVSFASEDNKAVVTVKGTYTTTEALSDDQIKTYIKDIMLDFQGNPHMQAYYESGKENTGVWEGDWGFNAFYAYDVVLGTDGTYTAKYDVTSLRSFCFTGHYGGTSGDFDFKPPMDAYEETITVGGKIYTLSYVPGGGTEDFYGCVGIYIHDANSYRTTGVTLEAKNGKPYMVISGKYEGFTAAELEAEFANIYADILNIPDYSVNGDWTEVAILAKGESLLLDIAADGTFTICLDLSGNVADGWALFAHLSLRGDNHGNNFTCNNVDLEASITVGGFTYTFQDTTSTGDWKTNLVVVKVKAA